MGLLATATLLVVLVGRDGGGAPRESQRQARFGERPKELVHERRDSSGERERFGGDGARFGAARNGHTHQGQDVLAAEGTPIVTPLAGTVTHKAYQASGAGYYLIVHGSDNRDYAFMHCQKDSIPVEIGQVLIQGQQICLTGHTSDASGPHHFEIWVGGWWAKGGYSLDSLPDLKAWDTAGASNAPQ